MPFKSVAQMHKFYALMKEGKMSPKTVREWQSHTNVSKIPKKVKKKK